VKENAKGSGERRRSGKPDFKDIANRESKNQPRKSKQKGKQPTMKQAEILDQIVDEPITLRRIQRRLAIVIEAMPRSGKEIYTTSLLPTIIADLQEIKAALAYLESQQK
jgi:hypothetical protein